MRLEIKKISVMLLICIMIFNVIIPILDVLDFNTISARITEDLPVSYIDEEFPDSYLPYIEELQEIYPNAVFKAVHTNVDWDLAVEQETYVNNIGISTVSSSYSDVWKYMPDGEQIYIDGTFVAASVEGVKYVLDPRNSLTEELVFQFESLYFSDETSTVESVDKILYASPMVSSGDYGMKYQNNGKWYDMDYTYAYYIYQAGKTNDINPVYIASRIIQETSGDIVGNESINGSYTGYTGLYNFFNIGATPDSSGNNSVLNGLIYASSQGWTTPEISIKEGSATLAEDYIQWGQNTIYFQKFDVNNPGQAVYLFGSQYMTHIIAPQSESKLMYAGYEKADMLDSSFEFHIPVYLNMPEETVDYPGTGNNVGDIEYRLDGVTKVYLDDTSDSNVDDVFNLRSEASSSSSVILKLTETEEGMENRTAYDLISVDTTNGFALIELSDGTQGYIYLDYVLEYVYTKVSSISLNATTKSLDVGDTYTLKATISPTDAEFKDVTYKTSKSSVATVSSSGVITAKSEGTATITVTSENGVTATCKITVNATQSISFTNSSYSVYKDSYITVTPIISNSTITDYELEIEDESIAIIENGKIKGLKSGTTNIIATIKGTSISSTIPLNVVEKNLDNPVIFDESLTFNNNIISNIEPSTKVSSILNKIDTDYTVTFTNNDKTLGNSDIIGTGTILTVNDGIDLNLEYTILVYGDASGDGKISSLDYVMIKKYIMDELELTGVYASGADVSKDSKISSLDYVMIKKYIMGELQIEQ